jgi:predicted nucleic acid-binding protein
VQENGEVLVSPQVIGETFTNLLKASRDDESRVLAEEFAQTLIAWCDAKLDKDAVAAAFRLRRRYQISWWDAVLLASAERAGAEMVLTEDLNDGQRYGSVQAINPFRHAPDDVLGRALRN